MKEIFLVRHGRQCDKRCNVDVSLDDIGRRQAELAGKRMATYGIERIYSSNLIRAVETAEIIGKYSGLGVDILDNLEEIHFGGFTGKTDERIREEYADFRARRRLHIEDEPYPEGGECGADVVSRVMPVIARLCYRKENKIAIVTHGGVIRSVCAHILGADQKDKLKVCIDMENTSFTELIYDSERDFFFLERLNDFAHLEGHPELFRKNWKTSLERE